MIIHAHLNILSEENYNLQEKLKMESTNFNYLRTASGINPLTNWSLKNGIKCVHKGQCIELGLENSK